MPDLEVVMERAEPDDRDRGPMAPSREDRPRRSWPSELGALVGAADAGLLSMDRTGRCVVANALGASLLGYCTDEIEKRNLHVLLHEQRPDPSPAPCPACEAWESGAVVERDRWRVRSRDGHQRVLRITATPVSTEDGPRVVLALRDVSRRVERAERRRALRERQEEHAEQIRIVTNHPALREGSLEEAAAAIAAATRRALGCGMVRLWTAPAERDEGAWTCRATAAGVVEAGEKAPSVQGDLRAGLLEALERRPVMAETSAGPSPTLRRLLGDRIGERAQYGAVAAPVPGPEGPRGLILAAEPGRLRSFHPDERGLVSSMAHLAGIALEARRRRRVERALAWTTTRHEVTELLNREAFLDRMGSLLHPRRADRISGLLMVELPRLHRIAHAFGPDASDTVLRTVARRLRALAGEGEVLAHVGDTTFALALRGDGGRERLEATAGRARCALTEPVTLETDPAVEVQVDVRIGACRPGADTSAAELLRKAQVAAQGTSDERAGAVTFFEGAQGPDPEAFRGEVALRRALERDELTLCYQPIVELSSGRVVSVEALARWPGADEGWSSPETFIALAEKSGQIEELGLWVVRQVARDRHRWGRSCRHVPVSINVSPGQLGSRWSAERLHRALNELEETGPVRVEITENMIVTADTHAAVLRTDHRQLVVDDFGTGYSSIAALKRIRPDGIKIDRSFIQRITQEEGEAIVQTVLALARTLGIDVCAEGIESAAQRDWLEKMGCPYGQGFLFARPMTTEDVGGLIEEVGLRGA